MFIRCILWEGKNVLVELGNVASENVETIQKTFSRELHLAVGEFNC